MDNVRNQVAVDDTQETQPIPSKFALAMDIMLVICVLAVILTAVTTDSVGETGVFAALVFGVAGLRYGYAFGKNRR